MTDRSTRWRPAPIHLTATLAVTATTCATGVALRRDFTDWSFLPRLMIAVLVVHSVAALFRAGRMRGVIAVPLLALIAGVAHAAFFYGPSVRYGLPTMATVDLVRSDLRVVVDQFATAIAPVASDGPFARMAAVALLVCAVLGDTFAFRGDGRSEALVPAATLFIVTAATGVDDHRVLFTAAWFATAALTVGLLRSLHQTNEMPWLGSRRRATRSVAVPLVLIAVTSTLVGAAVGPLLPGSDAPALLDTRNEVDTVTEVVSPLVDIGARLREQGGAELFTAAVSGDAGYWRLISLPNFDGSVWNPPEEDLVELGDGLGPLSGVESATVTQDIVIAALGGPLVPAAYRPARVDSADLDLYWAPASESLVAPGDGLERGDRIFITAAVPKFSADDLRARTTAGAPGTYRRLGRIPELVAATAVMLTEQATNDFDRALALQQWFRTEFTYDLSVDLSNSSAAMEQFIIGRRGFCQQFAGTFAVMARSLGLPARVAVGFIADGEGPDGRLHVFGRDAHAWPEVWFDGVGWVAFEPTPGRAATGMGDYLGITVGDTTDDPSDTTTTTVAGESTTTTTTSATSTTTVAPVSTLVVDTSRPHHGLAVGIAVLMILLVLAIPLWLQVVVPVLRTRHRRRLAADSPRRQVVAAWNRTIRCLELLGAVIARSMTPLEVAVVATRVEGIDPRLVEALADRVTRATFASTRATELEARECTELADRIERMATQRFSLRQRVLAATLPRYLRRSTPAPITAPAPVASGAPSGEVWSAVDDGLVASGTGRERTG